MNIQLSIKIICLTLCIFLSSSAVYAQKVDFGGKVTFTSDATLEMITASSDKMVGTIDLKAKTFAFKVAARSFKGFNSSVQNEHFHENYIESTKYPYLSYSGKLLDDIPLSKDGTYEIRSKGFFEIHGVKKERILKNKITIKGNIIKITSSFTITLVDYKIEIPKVVNKKIAESIDVVINVQSI
jgi:hypothetical protein